MQWSRAGDRAADHSKEGNSVMDTLGSTKGAAFWHRMGLRSAVLILAAILMAGALTGCDDGGGETGGDAAPPATTN